MPISQVEISYFGNLSWIIILLKYPEKHVHERWSTKVFFLTLAMSDLIHPSVFGTISWSSTAFGFDIYRDSVSIHWCHLFDFVSRTSEGISSWLIFFLALERHVLISRPSKITFFESKVYVVLMVNFCFVISGGCSSLYFSRLSFRFVQCTYYLSIPWSVIAMVMSFGLYFIPNILSFYLTMQLLKALKQHSTRIEPEQNKNSQVMTEKCLMSVKVILSLVILQISLTFASTVVSLTIYLTKSNPQMIISDKGISARF